MTSRKPCSRTKEMEKEEEVTVKVQAEFIYLNSTSAGFSPSLAFFTSYVSSTPPTLRRSQCLVFNAPVSCRYETLLSSLQSCTLIQLILQTIRVPSYEKIKKAQQYYKKAHSTHKRYSTFYCRYYTDSRSPTFILDSNHTPL